MDGLSMHIAEGSPPVLHVGGEIDLATAQDFADALEHAISADSKLVVDLADVTFIDAAGLHAILHAAHVRRFDGPLTLVNAARVAWLLRLVGLDGLPLIVVREGQIGRAS